jgi:broad specificity phosphatase PhoE
VKGDPAVAAASPREQKWPQTLWIARHGQSAGNVARDLAEAGGMSSIDIAERDVDVPLSPLGQRQAEALGSWFKALDRAETPSVVLHSPYVRARQTAVALLQAAGLDELSRIQDERLREKEFGILDRLTVAGIASRFPELAEQRRHVGKFYFRPPGGESWCDVILRLRSFLEMLTREYRGERVLIVAHQVTVNCLRYLLERMDETLILEIDRKQDVPNCAVTSYEFDPLAGHHGKLVLVLENFVSPLREAGAPVTAEPDAPVASKA